MSSSNGTNHGWVDSPTKLTHMLRKLEGCTQLAVDTESNSLFVYRERVCLIQFSTPTADYLVDPLALHDLSPLAPIFASPEIEKIFHAAEYDVICLKRDFGFTFDNLFDTMLAARILGYSEIGLAALLQAEFDVQMDKRFQRANWGKRPLPAEQLAYARLDTHYLIPLKQRLSQRLEEKGLMPLAREDFRRMTQVNGASHENGLAPFWRMAGKAELTSQQLAVLYELYEYRDQRARQVDRPVFKVFSDQVLVAIAQQLPHTPDELGRVRGLNSRMLKKTAEGLLGAVQKGLRRNPPQRQSHPLPNGRYLQLHEALRTWRKETARQLSVESDIVLPREVMETIARRPPNSLPALKDIMQDLPWRFEQYGSQIINLVRNQEGEK